MNACSFLADDRGVPDTENRLNYLPKLLSGLPIPSQQLSPSGWVHNADGLLFWVPEDCRNGLTSPAITIIPNTGHHRRVHIDFTHFQYGSSWTYVCGKKSGGES